MKKFRTKLYLIIITTFMSFALLNVFKGYVNAEQISNYKLTSKNEQSQNLCNEALLSMLYPYITSSVEEHFGVERRFDLFDAKVISIKKPSEKFEFEIIVEVDTFTGAHNPPGGIVTITFNTSPYGTKVISFKDNSQ